MTNMNLLEKSKKLEQRNNRLKQLETTLNIQERKNRTRRLIELGGLFSQAQLENWNSNALLGGFLYLKEKEKDATQITLWVHKPLFLCVCQRLIKLNVKEMKVFLSYVLL